MSDYVTVYVAYDQLEAEMVRGFLEASGIPAMLSQESIGKVLGLASGPLGQIGVLVPAEKSEEARALLESMERGDLVEDEEESSADEEGLADEEPPADEEE